MQKALSSKFRYRRCCVRVIMRPAGYLIRPHVAQGASWVWDPWYKPIFYITTSWNPTFGVWISVMMCLIIFFQTSLVLFLLYFLHH